MPICCHHCQEKIRHKKDLIVTGVLFKFETYHERCYRLLRKRMGALYFGRPASSRGETIAAFAFLGIFLYNLSNPAFRGEPIVLLMWGYLVLSIFYRRFYSYYFFERKLKMEEPNAL